MVATTCHKMVGFLENFKFASSMGHLSEVFGADYDGELGSVVFVFISDYVHSIVISDSNICSILMGHRNALRVRLVVQKCNKGAFGVAVSQ
ncbi:hypothetical protein Tco_0277867 [Tanacetum coccineum]